MLWFSSNAGVGLPALFAAIYGCGGFVILTAIRIAFSVVARQRTGSPFPIRWFTSIFACLAIGVACLSLSGPRQPLFRWRVRLSEQALTQFARGALAAGD